MTENIFEIENLTYSFSDGVTGIDGITLKIREGSFVVIAGKNGSGKTTFLRHLNGLLLPTSGIVRLNGISVSQNLKKARQMVGMIFQDADSQIVAETVYDDVAFGPENFSLNPCEIKSRVSSALDAVGLTEFADKNPHILSGGEKRRLAIAGILAMNPQIMVFDEPFSNLDYPGVKQVLSQILILHKNGHTIIITTHDLEKVICHADHLIIMEKGRIVKNGVPNEIISEVEKFGIRMPCAYRWGMKPESWADD